MTAHSTQELPAIRPEGQSPPQPRRFEWLADQVERWVGYYDADELREFLEGPNQWPGQREKALVLLALAGTDRAIEVLESFDPPETDSDLAGLHRVAVRCARE